MSAGASRGVTAVGSVLLATAVSVVVNVWSSGWGWPAGAGLAVLVAVQGVLEFRRAAGGRTHAPQPAAVTVEQRVREAVDTDVTGVRGIPGGGQINVTQVVGRARGGSVTGVANAGEGGTTSGPAPAPDGSGDA